jgi:small subunit ribosomal protein S1
MVWMNDDQLGQPQDAEEAQNGSEGNSGTDGMDSTDASSDMGDSQSTGDTADTGDMTGMEDLEIEAQATDAAGESASEEAAPQVDSSAGDSMADTGASAEDDAPGDTSSAGGEDASVGASMPGADMDAGAGGSAEAGTPAAAATTQEATRGPERSEERPGRPSRPQYEEDDDSSDEMVIHTARDPRMDDIASNASMEDLMKASERQYRAIKHGDVIEGTVMKVGRDEIMVDIGGKTEGVISSRESTTLTDAEREALQIGDTLLVSVVQPHNSEGQAVLSLDRARQEKAWRDLQRSFEAGETISAPVVGHNKGGILVNIEGIRGFVPSSQVSSLPPGEANKQAEMARLHNQSIPLKIIEINRHRNRLILSERQAMQEQRESMRARLLLELEPGQIRPGTVTSVCDFGAFVDIGGADGLIHLSELSWKRVSHPSEMLKVGDRINVFVLSIDQHERKIALSLKRTQPEPWETITDQYQLGQMVRGTITQITTFGAFARLDDGIEGLIHVSELAEGRVAHPRNVVKEGEVLDLKVIRIDPARKRIGLSLKRVNEDANREAEGASGEQDTSGMGASGGMDAGMEGGASGMQSQGDGTAESQPRQERQEQRQDARPPRPPQGQGQQRQGGQGQRPGRPQQPQQPLTSQSEDFEHLGAFAAALAAHTQQASAQPESDTVEEAEEAPAQEEQSSDPGEVLGSLSGINTSADMDATSAMQDAAGAEEETSDVADTADLQDQGGGADSMPGDRSDTTGTTPEMGAFGAADEAETDTSDAEGTSDTADATSMTDVTTDSGDMPSEEEQVDTGDVGTDIEMDASAGDESSDADEESQNATSADSDSAPEEESESTSPAFTDVAADSGDMVGEAAEASMPSSESMDDAESSEGEGTQAEDSAGSSEETSSEESGGDDASPADASSEDGEASPSSDAGDDLDSGAPSGSEGAPSTADSDSADDGEKGEQTEQG